MKKLPYLLLVLCFGCTNFLLPNSKFNRAWYLALGGIGISVDDGELPPPVDIVAQPALTLPSGSIFDSPNVSVSVNTSNITVPNQIGGLNVPIGKVYDIDLKAKLNEEIEPSSIKTVIFSEPVVLEYSYNKEALENAGFLEEFQVFYFSQISNQWEPTRDIVVDQEKGKVFAKTDHFTPFILTAVPKQAGTGVAAAPACLSTEMPIAGSAGAVWTQIDEHFKYYKDRNYTINLSPDFLELQFSSAYGIATCNGGSAAPDTQNCGPFAQHKHFNGSEYIKFTASEDMTVYVMYDSRGSQDATWLSTDSWVRTNKQIFTTDGVGYYKVYQKQFLKNDVVIMHGNRQGIPANAGVETNYWAVVKPNNLGGSSCLVRNSLGAQIFHYIEIAIAGSESATFLWTNNKDPRFENIIVRRKKNIPPTSVEDGVAPNITEIDDIGFKEIGLDPYSTYYYAIFARNADGILSLPDIYRIDTGIDSDNDGITDLIESNSECFYKPWHDYNCNSNPTLADSDGDGLDDYNELIYNTKMDNSDITPPVISKFELLSKPISSLNYPIFYFETEESVDIHFRYLITNTPIKPNPSAMATNIPENHIFSPGGYLSDGETKEFYLWIKDGSGNISNASGPIQFSQSGLKTPKYIAGIHDSKTFGIQSLSSRSYDGKLIFPDTNNSLLTDISDVTFIRSIKWGKIPSVMYIHGGKLGTEDSSIYVYTSKFYPTQFIQKVDIPNLDSFVISEDGRNLYSLNLVRNDDGMKISQFRIQSDGTLVYIKKSSPLNQIKYDTLHVGKNQSIYATNFDYGNITKINGETLELMPVTMRSYETTNLRFHPGGKYCYQLNPVPDLYLEKCDINLSNGNLTFRERLLGPSNQYLQFEITPDGNFMAMTSSDNFQNLKDDLILYSIDQNTGNLVETDRIVLSNYQRYSGLKIDQSSQYVFLLNKNKKIIYYVINQNNGKFYGPIESDLVGYERIFEIQSTDYATYQVQTNITQLYQPGFVHGYNEVKYPLPFTFYSASINIAYPDFQQLVYLPMYGGTHLQIQNTDLGYMSCNKKLSNYEETVDFTNQLGEVIPLFSYGDIWNRRILLNYSRSIKDNDLFFLGSYRLKDSSSNCKPFDEQPIVNVNLTRKKLSVISQNNYLPVGQLPNDIDSFTSVAHSTWKGVNPINYYLSTCTIDVIGCSLKPIHGYCDIQRIVKNYKKPYMISVDKCLKDHAPKYDLTFVRNAQTLITGIEWRWDKFQVTDP